jgi:hypothetical protein
MDVTPVVSVEGYKIQDYHRVKKSILVGYIDICPGYEHHEFENCIFFYILFSRKTSLIHTKNSITLYWEDAEFA